jgi:WD40 repeat protein
VAGSGKSTIAKHLSEQWKEKGLLGGCFFFSKNLVDATSTQLFCNTIAVQLAHNPIYQSQLQPSIIEGIKGLGTMTSFKEKLLKLVIKPIKELALVIVIDALDECNENDRRALLDCLIASISLSPCLKILVTSRPELDIDRRLQKYRSNTDSLHHAELKSNQTDIEIFVEEQMKDLVSESIISSKDVELLCQRVNCLFILASTACRAICNHPDPPTMLEVLLSTTSNSLVDINKLYLRILGNACRLEEVDERSWIGTQTKLMQVLKAVVSAIQPLTIPSIQYILGTKDIARVIKSLASVLNVTADETVLLLHPTFREFLIDKRTANQFYIHIDDAHGLMAKGCLQVMLAELRFNICGLESSFLLNSEVNDMEDRVSTFLSRQLQYSSVHWLTHVVNSGHPSHDPGVTDSIMRICQSPYPLYWMEVLSALRQVSNVLSGLQDVQDWLLVSITFAQVPPSSDSPLKDSPTIRLLYDIRRFILSFSVPITDSIPHIYISALPFSPIKSTIHQEGHKMFPRMLSVIIGSSKTWPEPLQVWRGHIESVTSVSISIDGRTVLSGSDDGTIRLWDTDTGQPIGEPLRSHTNLVRSVAFSPHSRRIVSGSYDDTIIIWDAQSGRPIGEPIQGHTGSVLSVAFSPDGHQIISGSSDGTIRLWNAQTGHSIGEPFQDHMGPVFSVAFSPDGRRIASGSYRHTIRLWDAESSLPVGDPLRGHTSSVTSVAFSPNGLQIVSGSRDHTIRLWDSKTGQSIGQPIRGHVGSVFCVAFSPDGRRIVSGSYDDTIRLWDTNTGEAIGGPIQGHSSSVFSVIFSPDGNQIISGSGDKTIRLWDTKTGHPIGQSEQGHVGPISSVSFSPTGFQIVSGSYDSTIMLWDAETGQPIGKPLRGHNHSINSVAFSPDGRLIVSGSYDNTIILWDVKTGQSIGEPLRGHTRSVNSVAFSPDEPMIVSGSNDGTVRLWDTEIGQAIGEPLQGHATSVFSVAFSPDGDRIISGSGDRTIRLWNARTGQSIGTPLRGHIRSVTSVSFSLDSLKIVSGSNDGTIRIWNAETGQTIGKPMQGHTSSILSVAFSPDSRQIVSGSYDKTIILWDTETRQSLGEPIRGHRGSVTSVSFSPDARQIVSVSYDHTIRLWNIENYLLPSESPRPCTSSNTPIDNSRIFHQVPRLLHSTLTTDQPEFNLTVCLCFILVVCLLRYSWDKHYGSHFSAPGFDDCTLLQNGWVVSSGKLIYWVPPSNRHGIRYSHTLTIPTTSHLRATWVDFSHFQCGSDWTKIQIPL